MANAEPEEMPSAEEVAEMERRLNLYHSDQARQRAQAMQEKGGPLVGFAKSDAFAEVEAKMAEFETLIEQAGGIFPSLRVYVDAVRNGLAGFKGLANSIPQVDPAA